MPGKRSAAESFMGDAGKYGFLMFHPFHSIRSEKKSLPAIKRVFQNHHFLEYPLLFGALPEIFDCFLAYRQQSLFSHDHDLSAPRSLITPLFLPSFEKSRRHHGIIDGYPHTRFQVTYPKNHMRRLRYPDSDTDWKAPPQARPMPDVRSRFRPAR